MREIKNNELREGMLVTDITPGGQLKPVYFTFVKMEKDRVCMKHTDHPLGATKEEGGYIENKDGLTTFSSVYEWYLVEEDENN
jgi:hypothetical protein